MLWHGEQRLASTHLTCSLSLSLAHICAVLHRPAIRQTTTPCLCPKRERLRFRSFLNDSTWFYQLELMNVNQFCACVQSNEWQSPLKTLKSMRLSIYPMIPSVWHATTYWDSKFIKLLRARVAFWTQAFKKMSSLRPETVWRNSRLAITNRSLAETD